MTTIRLILDAGSTPAISTIYKRNKKMFWWFKKDKKEVKEPNFNFEDTIESTLWEIKQEYDLETEEVERTVFQKRNYLNYMSECLKNKK